jgi:hypothetical protein
MLFKKVCLLLPVLALFVVSQASATLVTYTDQATFAAATSNLTTVNLGAAAPANDVAGAVLPYTNGGITMDSDTTGADHVGWLVNNAWGFSGTVATWNGNTAHLGTLSVPTGGTQALGVDLVYGGVATSGFSGTFHMTDGSTQAFNLTLPAGVDKNVHTFIGLTSSATPISSITINAESVAGAWVGDISYQATPEPGTIVLLTTGLIGLLAYAWRKRK